MMTSFKVSSKVLLMLLALLTVTVKMTQGRPRLHHRMTEDVDYNTASDLEDEEEHEHAKFVKEILRNLERKINFETELYNELAKNSILLPRPFRTTVDTEDRSIWDQVGSGSSSTSSVASSSSTSKTPCPEGQEYNPYGCMKSSSGSATRPPRRGNKRGDA